MPYLLPLSQGSSNSLDEDGLPSSQTTGTSLSHLTLAATLECSYHYLYFKDEEMEALGTSLSD